MLIRHSVRDHLPLGEVGYTLPITETGVRLARDLGELLGPRLRSIHASPLMRTMQTAHALSHGAGLRGAEPVEDRLLGDPGAFVLDDVAAGATWQELGHEAVISRLVNDEALAGLADPDPAARFLARTMLARVEGRPGIHAFVTHDSLVTVTAARLLNKALPITDWPWYLEAAFFWEQAGGVQVRYREMSHVQPGPLCTLGSRDVLDFARREIAATVGLGFPGRFLLSGGAFKSLLTGHRPQKLELWAPTPADRELLIDRLRSRGAEQVHRSATAEAWALNGRAMDVPKQAEPSSLAARHARYDPVLSGVGVEHLNGNSWRAVIPSAGARHHR